MYQDELNFFIENQQELVDKYYGKVLVLVGREVVDVYDTMLDAYLGAQLTHPLGSFMLQPCQPGPDAYTVTISSTNVALL